MSGINQKSASSDEDGSSPVEDWLATTIEIQELAGANPAVAPHSCPHCREWEIDLYHNTLNHVAQTSHEQIQGGPTVSYAQKKAELGCALFERCVRVETPPRRSISDGAVLCVRCFDLNCSPGLSLRWDNPDQSVRNAMTFIERYEIYLTHDIRPSTGVLASRIPPNLVPNSCLSYRRIRNWVQECISSHAKCSSRPRNFMPLRVLHISGTAEEPTIRLSNSHPTVPYATLSYCWGADQPAKTTRSNFSSYLSDVPFFTLPSTVRDAAKVTRGIGLSYLWVDAMCIIQDDHDDVMVQISQMHSIYNSSWVTIAAAEAVTCNDGFLQPQSRWKPFRMKARSDEDGPFEVLLVPEGDSYRRDAPLFERGWTMQETSLSTRLLIYGQRELIYLCLEGERCEGGDPFHVGNGELSYELGSAGYLQKDHPQSWGYLVSRYSQRLLAVEGDKLLGIAGLAEAYGRRKTVSGYFAGMWRENFLEQCLWTISGELYSADYKGVARHPKKYRAPSWSWASLDGHISCFGSPWNRPLVLEPEAMAPIITCDVVDIQTTVTAAGNPFGMVTGGCLVLRGRLRQVIWQYPGYRMELVKGAEDRRAAKNNFVHDLRMDPRIDCPKHWKREGDVLLWSLEICKTQTGRGYAILLQEAEHRNGLFQRVGRLDINSDGDRHGLGNWFESEYEFREITII